MEIAPLPALRTARLVLEPLRVDHAAEMVDVLADPALYTYTGGEPPDLKGLTGRYERQVAGSGDDNEIWSNWVARSRADGRAVGFVQATIEVAETSVAWVIGTEHQGGGLATEAASAMVDWLETTGVERFVAYIAPGHTASERVAADLSFTGTGKLDEDGEQIWLRQGSQHLTSEQ